MIQSGLDDSDKTGLKRVPDCGLAGRDTKGTLTISTPQHADAAGLHMLFAPGTRPARPAIVAFTARQQSVSLSHDPIAGVPAPLAAMHGAHPPPDAAAGTQASEGVWLELLREGLTFDLHGLAPGRGGGIPPIAHRFDYPAAASPADCEALTIVPGPHLAGGERSMPVLRGMFGLARDLTQHFVTIEALVWGPSRAVIGRRFFESVITAWLEGGAFPALGLTAFEEAPDGALQSVGLAHWIGQELRIEPPLSGDKIAATRLAVRLVNQLVIVGGLETSERIVGPDGARLVMQPSRGGDFVGVRRE